MIYYVIIVNSMCCVGIAYFLGKYHERIAWNRLIQKGRIPKPY